MGWLRAKGLAGVPRQFGVVRVLGMLVVFALAFGLLRWLGAPTSVFVGVTLFFVLVGTGQSVLFRGREPRAASVLAGMIAGPIVAVVTIILEMSFGAGPPHLSTFQLAALALLVVGAGAVWGAPCGYVAGMLLAAVFLVPGPDLESAQPTPTDLPDDKPPSDPFAD